MRQPLAALLAAAALAAGPAAAQATQAAQAPAAPPRPAPERPPAARQGLAELAYVLGQSHGLAQTCRRDGFRWYDRMQRLLQLEAPEAGFRRQLIGSFNDGYEAARIRYPRCDPSARRALATAATRGRDIAGVIAAAR